MGSIFSLGSKHPKNNTNNLVRICKLFLDERGRSSGIGLSKDRRNTSNGEEDRKSVARHRLKRMFTMEEAERIRKRTRRGEKNEEEMMQVNAKPSSISLHLAGGATGILTLIERASHRSWFRR